MHLALVDLIIIVGYIAATLLIGFLYREEGVGEHGKSLPRQRSVSSQSQTAW